jgi:(1->4)-alpha-D-glucan 1-alpha-D-glucosylmutase
VIRQALSLRRRQPALFGAQGDYLPLLAEGAQSEHVVAFARGARAVTVVPRLRLGRHDGWADTTLELPPGRWRNELTGDELSGGIVRPTDLFERFPVCLLARAEMS